MMSQSTTSRLVDWYRQQCDGEWEHEFGVKIESEDGPGWGVYIDITNTEAWHKPFVDVNVIRSETDWYRCSLKNGSVFGSKEEGFVHFVGYGGSANLEEVIQSFIDFVYR